MPSRAHTLSLTTDMALLTERERPLSWISSANKITILNLSPAFHTRRALLIACAFPELRHTVYN